MRLVGEGARYTLAHQELLCDLLRLCTSAYSQVGSSQSNQSRLSPAHQLRLQVRARAQSLLASAMVTFSFAYRDLLPRIVQLLQRGDGTPHQFKVAG